jgi:hypothetical protein
MAITRLGPNQDITAAKIAGQINFKNLIINGDMSIDQRNSGSSITPTNGQYGVDRWQNAVNVSSKYSIQQVSDAPTGFVYSNKVTSLSAYSIGAGELAGLRQYIEGYNITKLDWGTSDAQTVTLSFWVKSSLTGDFGVTVGNDNGRTYGALYNISSADTWEKKSVTIEGDTSGTWLTTNGKGISLVFALSTGSTFLATANSWNASTSYGVTGQTQILATNSATWQVTGVQLEADTSASDFEFLPYDVNLQRCERYYQLLQGFEGSMRTSVGFGCTTMFRTQMRSAPSVTQSGALQITDGNADFTQSSTSVSIPASRVTTLGVQLYFVNFSGLTQFRPAGQNTNVNDSKVGADAEL